MAQDHKEIRHTFIVSAQQLRTIILTLRRAVARLPEVPEAMLALTQEADTASTLRLAVNHIEEEMPELAQALIDAARCTPEALAAEHRAYLFRMAEAERSLLAPPGGEESEH